MDKDTNELRSNPIGAGAANGAAVRAANRGSVEFIGLGRMGTAMAANLAAAGVRVIAYVRRSDRWMSSPRSPSSPQRTSRISSIRDVVISAARR